jgi:cysteine desulfurase/selenocysteine lyase
MIYLDNAATSFPKPPCVIDAIVDCLKNKGANPGRGAHQAALAASRIIFEAREALADLLNVDDSSNIIFTLNATDSLNLGIKGLLQAGDHAITTSMEHNSVSRPLNMLERTGVSVTKIECDRQGHLDLAELQKAVNPRTRLIVSTHASNVAGTLMPLADIAAIASNRQVTFMVDAAQTAGSFPLDVQRLGIDILACSGHKSLMGPQGTGVLYISPEIELMEIRQGGTGGDSENPLQPTIRPERYESGTPNTPGIAGLGAAARFIRETGIDRIRDKEQGLVERLMAGLAGIGGVRLYGPPPSEPRAPVVSFNLQNMGCHEVAFALDKGFDVAARAGLHCAPDAHRSMGTLDSGTVRLSVGFFNTENDIDAALEAIKHIAEE